ncbi:hypothetical protein [Sphingopyxis sp.]|jgi:hypothetical protein|uniref:hypothetical protein n=1 Tax=Sphingopyxis sp. TaxID=1908224 RepID=UPI002DF56C6C|nr:hypothetical protein [Sphingopyxis sp.]
MAWEKLALVCCTSLVLGGCATVAFKPPPYSYKAPGAAAVALDATNSVHVLSYLRGATDTFDMMLENSEKLKYATELPIIAAGIFAPTTLALGNNSDGAIYAAGVGAAGGALSNYFGVRTRQVHVAQAREAVTCVSREYANQFAEARTLGASIVEGRSRAAGDNVVATAAKTAPVLAATSSTLLSITLDGAATSVAGTVASSGDIAIEAANSIISKLKVKLAGVGTAPNYSDILNDLKAKQALSVERQQEAQTKAGANAFSKAAIASLADYPLKIAECVAKFPG